MLEEMSLEKQVSADTPPAFIWHTFNDGAVPVENSLMFAQAMRECDIPFELHIYPDGEHGLSLANEETSDTPQQINSHVAGWMDLCLKWIGTMV
jgi:dipeptidyl aminopeptidase/acylaminoacyl peptidase